MCAVFKTSGANFILLLIIVLSGCASRAVTELRDETFSSAGVRSLACMPFIKARECLDALAGDSAFLDCRFSALRHTEEFYAPGALQEISLLLHEDLRRKYGMLVKDYGAGLSVFESTALKGRDTTLRSRACAFGTEFGVEYVVVGVLDTYREREGSAGGVTRPASVAFKLYLVHVPTGSAVFEGAFSETQQALSDNILKAPAFFRRGARWLTAGELAREGITRILDDIP